MKFRTDFITNSSSSGFVVGFKKAPKTAIELQEMLFGDVETYGAIEMYGEYGSDFPACAVAERVFEDMCEKNGQQLRVVTPEQIERETVNTGWINWEDRETLEYDDERFLAADGRIDWERYNSANEAEEKDILASFMKIVEKEGLTVFVFEYSDNDGEFYAALEHGGLFDKLDPRHVIRISRH